MIEQISMVSPINKAYKNQTLGRDGGMMRDIKQIGQCNVTHNMILSKKPQSIKGAIHMDKMMLSRVMTSKEGGSDLDSSYG